MLSATLLGALTTTSILPASAQRRRNPIGRRQNLRQTYTGRVTNVRSNQSFDITSDGSTYNVYTLSRLPRRLSQGDHVQVTGVQVTGIRQYNNDIRQASVVVIRNR